MLLLKHPMYHAAFAGYLEFQRSPTIHLDEPALEAPLENLPKLYQVWGTLQVLTALLEIAAERGYRIKKHQLARKDQYGIYIRLLPNGDPALVLEHPERGTIVKFIPERSYRQSGKLRSFTYEQRPDIAVEIQTSTGETQIYLFDPKYKLHTESDESEHATPQKSDIDKMHTYRDAIRDQDGTLLSPMLPSFIQASHRAILMV